MEVKDIGGLFEKVCFRGSCNRLPVNPDYGDIYLFRNKTFIWINRWEVLNPIIYLNLKDELISLISNTDDDNLIEVLENFIKEHKKEQGVNG